MKHATLLNAVLVAAVLLLGGCASGTTRLQQAAKPTAPIGRVSGVQVTLSEAAKAQLTDNIKFSAESLRETVERVLSARGAMDSLAPHRISITVKDIRVRSSFSAIMFGFMAGDDHVQGMVELLNGADTPVDSFEVSASYAFGGIAGGQDSTRLGYLYEAFAKETAGELLGNAPASPQVSSAATANPPAATN
jgi:hypothetical protein